MEHISKEIGLSSTSHSGLLVVEALVYLVNVLWIWIPLDVYFFTIKCRGKLFWLFDKTQNKQKGDGAYF